MERNFKIQTPDNVQQEFWVVLHFHHQQSSTTPAKPASLLKSQVLFAMSQSSCTCSSIYAISVLSAANSVDDIGLFMCIDSVGNQIIISTIIIELNEFDGSDFIAIEESTWLQVQVYGGSLRPPT